MGERSRLLLTGVGGQGVLTAAKILGDAVHAAGLPVVVGQLHGMSQRGGSVECSVLIGEGASSFITGGADLVIGFEPLETLRVLPQMGAHTRVIMNEGTIVPYAIAGAGHEYPPISEITASLREVVREVLLFDGPRLLGQVGEGRTLNVAMIGALSGLDFLPVSSDTLWRAVARRCPERYLEANRRAFELGRDVTAPGQDREREAGESGHG